MKVSAGAVDKKRQECPACANRLAKRAGKEIVWMIHAGDPRAEISAPGGLSQAFLPHRRSYPRTAHCPKHASPEFLCMAWINKPDVFMIFDPGRTMAAGKRRTPPTGLSKGEISIGARMDKPDDNCPIGYFPGVYQWILGKLAKIIRKL